MITPLAFVSRPFGAPSTWIEKVQELAVRQKADRVTAARLANLRDEITMNICAGREATDDMIEALYLIVLYQRQIAELIASTK